MAIWVICEGQSDGFRRGTLELVAQARRVAPDGGEVVAVAVGSDAARADALAGRAHRILKVEGEHLEPFSADPWVEALAPLLEEAAPSLVLWGEGQRAREVVPRLAARLGWHAVMNGLALERRDGGLRLLRPVCGGKAYQWLSADGAPLLAAFRPNSFDPEAPADLETAVEARQVSPAPARVQVLERTEDTGQRVDLTEAQVVVSGGRGLRSPENLKLLEELADALGGAVGVSRAVVDAGWADHSIQVGKSGKTVSPALYIAAGISGAVHHTMGMDTAKVVVAINTDPNAPIFRYADYGIVGDALQVLPALTRAIRELRA